MATRAPALAKLTRPRLYDALPRPRLFAALDEACQRPVAWVTAPPGSGKTTLVASWLEARRLRHLWYQVDAGDSDTATFMHYLRLAAQALAGRRADALPPFTLEPQQDLARFSRGFCRDLFAALPQPCVIVLDNFHEARTTAAQRAALAQGFEEIPDGINVVVLSRGDPPPEFARLAASRRIARLDASLLRFDADESTAMLGTLALPPTALSRVQRQGDGWAAALVLLREHLSRPGATVEDSLGEGQDAIFQYFAGEVFNGARPENRRLLMLTAIPPSITAEDALAVSGSDEAPRLLDYLYRRHLFVDRRRSGERITYHYHALFRAFLLAEGRRRLPDAERARAAAALAPRLAARDQPGDALALWREAGDFDAMHALIRERALEWARQGRGAALSDWIDALPKTMRDADPWLSYWQGRAWIFAQPSRGRPSIEAAWRAFVDAGDLKGQALALNTLVTSYYYEWANFTPLDRWLPEFDRLLPSDGQVQLDAESELRARSAQLIALLFRRPGDPALDACARRLDALLDGERDVNARMMAASTLFNYYNWTTKGDVAAPLVARVAPVLQHPDVTPLMQLWWRTHLSFWHYVNGRYEACTTVTEEARAIADRYGLEAYLFEIDHAEASALVSKGDYATARTRLQAIERRLTPARRMDAAYFQHLTSTLEQRLGHAQAALQAAERAVEIARETGLPSMQVPHFLVRLAHCRAAAGDRDGALAAFDEAVARAEGFDRIALGQQRELTAAGFALDDGDEVRAQAQLAQVLADYRARGQQVLLRSRPDLAARLAAFALARGIEAEYVRLLVERNALPPPPDAPAAWPFRLRVRALGGFELTRDGEPMRFTGKAQQRPLDLLKLLVAHGGEDVDTAAIAAALWPDADGAAARTSFDTTLFRLRKLVDVDGALELAAGKLSLSRTRCWTDVRALDAALAATASLDAATPDALRAAARRLLDAYSGPLLGAEEAPWIAKPRDALRARIVRALGTLGERLEQAGERASAVELYRRGLEADNLAEPLYRGLMRTLAASGDHAEALNAYRRCRELLSVVLGLAPSAETERLHRAIVAAAPPRDRA